MSIIEDFRAARRVTVAPTLEQIRMERNKMLQRTDWTQMPDSPLSQEKRAEWAEYRQALRDMFNTSDVNNIAWPVKPA